MSAPNFVAGGNISPSRFVKQSAAYTVQQCGASSNTERPFGISQEGTRAWPGHGTSPTLAAISGDPVKVYTEADVCLLEVAAACSAGDYLVSDANGKGTPLATLATGSTTTTLYGAVALEAATADTQKIKVQIKIGPFQTNA